MEITETQTCTHTQATYTLHTYILLQLSYNETLQKGSKQNKTLDLRAYVRLSNILLRLVQRSYITKPCSYAPSTQLWSQLRSAFCNSSWGWYDIKSLAWFKLLHVTNHIQSSAWHGVFSWVLRILAAGPGSKIVGALLFALLRGMFTGCPSRFWGKQGCPYRALPCLCGWHLPWVEKRGICATRKLWKRAGAAVALSRVRVNGWSV